MIAGSGIPCKISFSKAEMRDVHLLPVSKGISGKLLLVEKHPHRDLGVVIAVEPLAGLNVSPRLHTFLSWVFVMLSLDMSFRNSSKFNQIL